MAVSMDKEREKERKKEFIDASFKSEIISNTSVNEDLGIKKKYKRSDYEDKAKMKQYKDQFYGSKKSVKDPHTGKRVHKSHNAARNAYGDKNYAKHASETDHIVPLKKLDKVLGWNPFLSDEDRKEIGNDPKNLREISRNVNNQKRDTDDLVYITGIRFKKGTKKPEKFDTGLTNGGKVRMAAENIQAKSYILTAAGGRTVKNVTLEFKRGASDAIPFAAAHGLVLGVQNLYEVGTGQKNIEDAARETGKVIMEDVMLGGESCLVEDMIKDTPIRKIADQEETLKLAAMTAKSISRYVDGDITAEECVCEISETGVYVVVSGVTEEIVSDVVSKAVGEALGETIGGSIGGPVGAIVGKIVGEYVGSVAAGVLHDMLSMILEKDELEQQRRMEIIYACRKYEERMMALQVQLQAYLDEYYKEYSECFEEALMLINSSLADNDADGVVAGANMVTRKLGETKCFDNVQEYRDFLRTHDKRIF